MLGHSHIECSKILNYLQVAYFSVKTASDKDREGEMKFQNHNHKRHEALCQLKKQLN